MWSKQMNLYLVQLAREEASIAETFLTVSLYDKRHRCLVEEHEHRLASARGRAALEEIEDELRARGEVVEPASEGSEVSSSSEEEG
jgi:hypothetical protein